MQLPYLHRKYDAGGLILPGANLFFASCFLAFILSFWSVTASQIVMAPAFLVSRLMQKAFLPDDFLINLLAGLLTQLLACILLASAFRRFIPSRAAISAPAESESHMRRRRLNVALLCTAVVIFTIPLIGILGSSFHLNWFGFSYNPGILLALLYFPFTLGSGAHDWLYTAMREGLAHFIWVATICAWTFFLVMAFQWLFRRYRRQIPISILCVLLVLVVGSFFH